MLQFYFMVPNYVINTTFVYRLVHIKTAVILEHVHSKVLKFVVPGNAAHKSAR